MGKKYILVFKWFALIRVYIYACCPTSCKLLIAMRWRGNTEKQQVVKKSLIITNNEIFLNQVLHIFTIACLFGFFKFLGFQKQTFLTSFKKKKFVKIHFDVNAVYYKIFISLVILVQKDDKTSFFTCNIICRHYIR